MNYRYIVVEGSIGSGKSELSRRLAKHFEALHLTESPERNPFLEQFYLNASNHGLATELFFLMRRAENVDIINAEEDKGGRIIADFLLEKDQIFVPVVLKDPSKPCFGNCAAKSCRNILFPIWWCICKLPARPIPSACNGAATVY